MIVCEKVKIDKKTIVAQNNCNFLLIKEKQIF